MLGHAIVQVRIYLAVDGLCLFKKGSASLYSLQKNCAQNQHHWISIAYFSRQIKASYCVLLTAKLLQLKIKY